MKALLTIHTIFLFSVLMVGSALAHVPYIEHIDYTALRPFEVKDSIKNSKSIYAWFKTGKDVDVYKFEVTVPVRVFAQAIVPVCPAYEQLLPWFAVVGPGLPEPVEDLPLSIPNGYGAIVVENLAPGEPRTTFYEPFSQKYYYDGPTFDQEVSEPGTWYIYFWDPYEMGGDYVAVLGFEEVFTGPDIVRALINTLLIRSNRELHTECQQGTIFKNR
jgi:hypothetical protein